MPGVLRLTVFSEDKKINVSGCIDAGYPSTGIDQAMLMLPPGAKWEGLRLKAELEVRACVTRSVGRAAKITSIVMDH